MLSRSAALFKNAHRISERKQIAINLKQIRNYWCYRTCPKSDKTQVLVSEIIGGVAWWWILWNMWHNFDHLIGHFPYPVPADWSDEELGIPND